MKWSDIPRNPTSKVLRQFAAVWLVFFSAYGAFQYFKRDHHTLGLVFVIAAVVIGPLGLIKPATVRGIFVLWMILAFPIGWLVSQVMLVILFFLVLTPAALLFRLRGRDLLARKLRPDAATFWLPKKTPDDVRSYFRQY